MKVRMIAQISGVRDGKNWPDRGETIDLPADEAKTLCENGMAEPVDARKDKTETATPDESAVTLRAEGVRVEDLPKDDAGVHVSDESTKAGMTKSAAAKASTKKS